MPWQIKLVCGIVYVLDNSERANIAKCQLSATFNDLKVSGGEPHLIAWFIVGCLSTMSICKHLGDLGSVLLVLVNFFAHPLTLLEPAVHSK